MESADWSSSGFWCLESVRELSAFLILIIIAVFVIVMLTLPNSNEEKLKIPGSGFFVLNGYAPFPSYIIGSTYVDRFDVLIRRRI